MFLTQSRSALRNSLQGLTVAARSERAVRQELVVLAVALPAAFLIADQIYDWIALIGSLTLVLIVELLNTAIEKLCDHLHPGRHPAIGTVKDFGSAAVFCALIFALAVWVSLATMNVLLPHGDL